MLRKNRYIRMNSIGEDQNVVLDSPDTQEYEIDGSFISSIDQLKRPFLWKCGVETRLRDDEGSRNINSKRGVSDLHSDLSESRPDESSDSDDCYIIEIEKAKTCRYRNRSGEHKRKIQRRTSTEMQDINKNLNRLDIDTGHIEEMLKQDHEGDNMIAVAILSRYTRIARMLTDLVPCYSVLNVRNDMSQTLLHLAALTDNATMVRRLVVAGADITVRDRHGNTPLHIACNRSNVEVAEVLLEPVRYPETKENVYPIPYQKIPQNLEIRNSQGLTCLLISSYRSDTSMMELLLSKNADVNAYDMKNGKTSLHIFSERGDLEMVTLLMSKPGLDINKRTYSTFTAAELASYRGHGHVVSHLLYHGCDPDIRSITSGKFDAESSDSDDLDG